MTAGTGTLLRLNDGLRREPVPIELPAVAYVFRGPRSFTRQDVLELHIPGSPPAATALVAAMIDAGARQAQAGEFTARAFFSGRLDLSAAEAVADIIDSSQQAQLRQAVQALGGRIAALCRSACEELTDILACTEASIDLEQEQIELATPAEQARRLEALAARLRELADNAADMPERSHMPRVVLCGLPNAGKSSLLNALSGRQRAIVSEVAGTTRDVLSQTIVLQDSLVLLQDAAGLGLNPHTGDDVRGDIRCHPQASPSLGVMPNTPKQIKAKRRSVWTTLGGGADDVAQAADRAARGAVASADLLLLVVDAANPPPDGMLDRLRSEIVELNASAPLLVLANKSDLLQARGLAPCDACCSGDAGCLSPVSWPSAVVRNAGDRHRRGDWLPAEPVVQAEQGACPRCHGHRYLLMTTGTGTAEGTGSLRSRRSGDAGCLSPVSWPSVLVNDNGDRHLAQTTGSEPVPTAPVPSSPLFVSAVTGQGLELLRDAICERLHLQANRDGQVLGLHQRQKRHFIQAADAAVRAAAIFQASAHLADQAELAAIELRAALSELGAISGQVATEDVLGRIFMRFCVGK